MKELIFEDLKAEDVEARIGHITDNGFSILLYKDARCDVRQLDEKVGKYNWQVERYEKIDGVLYCFVSIWDDDKKQWITKGDCGIESKQQDDNKVKAESSDAFKRACYKWGIGIKLYNFKNIFIPCDVVTKNNNKTIPYDYQYLDVVEIDYNNMKVVFQNSKGKIIWQNGKVVDEIKGITRKTNNYKQNTASNTCESKTHINDNNNTYDKHPNQPVSDDIICEILDKLNSNYTLQQVKNYFNNMNWKYKNNNITYNFIANTISKGWIK